MNNNTQKHKTKKYLNLLKNSQNVAFVSLVIQNLSQEMKGQGLDGQARPDKVLKVADFMLSNVLKCQDTCIKTREFARLKVTEALVPLLCSKFDRASPMQSDKEQLFSQTLHLMTQGLNNSDPKVSQKWNSKVEKYSSMIYDIDVLRQDSSSQFEMTHEFSQLKLVDIVGSSKESESNLHSVMSEFRFLLRDCSDQLEVVSATPNLQENLTKEQLVKELDAQDFKLSDFIDSKFLESCLAPVKVMQINTDLDKRPLNQFVSAKSTSILPELLGSVNKRQKTENSEGTPKFLVLSPSLAMFLHFMGNLTNHTWEVRQVAACGIQTLLNELSQQQNHSKEQLGLEYGIVNQVNQQFEVGKIQKMDINELARAVLPMSILQMLKDQFSDYEDLNVLTPVRFQGMKVISSLCQFALSNPSAANLKSDISLSIKNMPQLLFACQGDWQAKLSFFMIMKALINLKTKENNEFRSQIFEIFGRDMLIESLLRVEDSVRITITELLTMFLDEYFASPKDNYIDRILTNLTASLKLTDDIEGSVIFVFNLIDQIVHLPAFNPSKSSFVLDLATFCPFNFHRVVLVRRTYNKVISRFLNIKDFFKFEDLLRLFTITVQSIIMEQDRLIRESLITNLKTMSQLMKSNLGPFVNYLNSSLLDPVHFQTWLQTFEMTDEHFKSFVFFESACFENINGDYFQLIYQPVNDEEKHQFYMRKLESCVTILSIIGKHAGLEVYVSQFLKMLQKAETISFHHIVELLVSAESMWVPECVESLSSLLLVATPERVNAVSMLGFDTLLKHLSKLMSMFNRPPNSPPAAIQQLCSMMNDAAKANSDCHDICHFAPNIVGGLHELKTQLNERASVEIDTLIYLAESLLSEIQVTAERYRALLINQHLTSFSVGNQGLHPKLNDLIYPILNMMKVDHEEFYQRVFAKAVCSSLLHSLHKAAKAKPFDGVMSLILKSIAKDDDFLESRGNGFLLDNLIQQELFSVYGEYKPNLFKKAFGSTIKPETVQNYVVLAGKIVMKLLHYLHDKKVSSLNLEIVFASLPQLISSIPSALQSNLPEVPSLIINLFHLLTCLDSSLQEDLILHLVSSLEALTAVAFISVEVIIDGCLHTPIAKSEEELDEAQLLDKKIQQKLSPQILKFIGVFLLPLIKSVHRSAQIFSDGDERRCMQILSMVIQLLPLCKDEIPDSLRQKLGSKFLEGQQFLGIFTQRGIERSDQIPLQVVPDTELRDYQKQGIHWMRQLGRLGLNCCLCDEMGLGKTIQSLSVVINESACYEGKERPVSLVICPNTLTYQWHKEIQKFFGNGQIRSAIYPLDPLAIQKAARREVDIIITSYEKARSDIEILQNINFFYLVLDEGHRIKNSKTKVTQAAKAIAADRKLVLSGTPLQNKVSELWSIFDFLMPNFLETEKVFNQKYNQFLTSNLNKLSEKLEETEKFIHALKSLKKRVAPFVLRRTKNEVLKDLPPKVIQDFECEMPRLQQEVHDFIERQYPISQMVQGQDENQGQQKKGGSQILQNLTLHRKACNHPTLVREYVPQNTRQQLDQILKSSAKNSSTMTDCSGKILGLIDLLVQCEIIESQEDKNDDKSKKQTKKGKEEAMYEGLLQLPDADEIQESEETPIVQSETGHRALIFCQMKSYLQMIIDLVLEPYGVKYLQMLSIHSGKERFNIVEQFNNDPSIKVCIMSTAVGGLGLNLTGADTVIFMEHDWNPMKDLQAIDRAHRIGQKRTVNVYRLILVNSLEEQIMSLQRFKKNLAKNLIESNRTELSMNEAQSMQIHDLLQCYEEHTVYEQSTKGPKKTNNKNTGAESYQDKVIETSCGPGIWEQSLEEL